MGILSVLGFLLLGLLKLIGILFLVALVFLLMILLLPVSYRGSAAWKDGLEGSILVGWPFGMISVEKELGAEGKAYLCFFHKRLFQMKKKEPKKKEPKEKTETPEKKASERPSLSYLKELVEMGLIRDIFEFLERFFPRLLPRRIMVKIRYGTEDPSLTGGIYGAYAAFPILRTRWNILLEPNFVEEQLEAEGELQGHAAIIGLLTPVLRLLRKKSIRKILRDRRRRKKNGKEK